MSDYICPRDSIKTFMDTFETYKKTIEESTYSKDEYFFSYIFKKTEKIVCAVLYILETEINKETKSVVSEHVERMAQNTIGQVHACLRARRTNRDVVETLGFTLLELESALRMASASQQLAPALLHVFVQEIDAVMRSMRTYLNPVNENPVLDLVSGSPAPLPQRTSVRSGTAPTTVRPSGGSATSLRPLEPRPLVKDRKQIISDVLKEKGQASIKDISEVIKDCSEKTIQRDLNEMIQKGLVLREGERRWSKYSLVSQ